MKWQPIDDLPKEFKDGRRVLLGGQSDMSFGKWVWDKGETLIPAHPTPYWEPYDNSRWEFEHDDWFEVTHFMFVEPPLPRLDSSPAQSHK